MDAMATSPATHPGRKLLATLKAAGREYTATSQGDVPAPIRARLTRRAITDNRRLGLTT